LPDGAREIFFLEGLDSPNQLESAQEIRVCMNSIFAAGSRHERSKYPEIDSTERCPTGQISPFAVRVRIRATCNRDFSGYLLGSLRAVVQKAGQSIPNEQASCPTWG
jgi:hypothetical protein